MRASLIELEAVAGVARHGGFRAAARELGMSSSALSHAIAALEERLAVRLFNRTTRSVSLSAAGEQFLSEIAPALQTLEKAIENVGEHSDRPSGRLRLNMAPGAARILLQPLILEYSRRYPDVDIEIVTENALVDVIGKGFDAGIRLTEVISPDIGGRSDHSENAVFRRWLAALFRRPFKARRPSRSRPARLYPDAHDERETLSLGV